MPDAIALSDLKAAFLELTSLTGWRRVKTIKRADGIVFLCPVCFVKNGGSRGTHSVICWRPRVPADVQPGPGRWEFVGSSLDDLTLVAGSSSIQLTGGCNWHGYVRDGKATLKT